VLPGYLLGSPWIDAATGKMSVEATFSSHLGALAPAALALVVHLVFARGVLG
jgi:hypothetical protein